MIIILLAAFIFMIYFAGTETAVCSLSSFQRDEILRGGKKSAAASLAKFLEKPHRTLTAILIGNALAVIIASVAVQSASMQAAEKYGLSVSRVSIIASAGLFFLVVFFGEILPKASARKNPKKFSEFALAPLSKMTAVLLPLAVFLFSISRAIFSFFGLRLSKTLPRTSSQEFAALAETAYLSGKISKEERRMIRGIVDFPEKEVRQVMVPEVGIDAVDINWGRERILREIASFNHSRIPVYSKHLDNIVGLIYTKDVMGILSLGPLLILQDIIRSPFFVPETAPVRTLLKNFMQGRQHLSIAVDEYGKVTGIITLEDVLEEITGDIFDEFDRETSYKKDRDGSFLVPAQEGVDRVNDKLSLGLPAETAESVGGLILEKLNYLPKKGASVTYGDVILEVESADEQKIKTVRIRKK
ncbi:MAG: hemolysin family protein [bacterium]